MIFGLPWFAIIPIVAIVGGLIYAYKEQELKLEEKRLGTLREVNEMRKMMINLKERVEKLEAKIEASSKRKKEEPDPLEAIELDENNPGESEIRHRSTKSKTR